MEAKWQAKLSTTGDLDTFGGKVRRKLDNTLGLFVSMSGFQPNAIELAGKEGRPAVILADGSDLMLVLDDKIDFAKLLARKNQHAARTGEVMLRAADVLASPATEI